MSKIDINCDMGESFGAYTIGMDEEAIKYISSANIACGFHAGDPMVMGRTAALASNYGVGAGAHPGYPDLVGFGRRNMECTMDEIGGYIIYQVGAMKAFCEVNGIKLQHVKPHGSLYNMTVGNETMAKTIAEAIANVDESLIYVTLAGPHAPMMSRIAEKAGIRIAFEAFPDRAYTSEGKLASRHLPGTVIKDPNTAAERALRMAKEKEVVALDGSIIKMDVQTLCVHGDNPSAVDVIKKIRETLEADGIEIIPMGEFC